MCNTCNFSVSGLPDVVDLLILGGGSLAVVFMEQFLLLARLILALLLTPGAFVRRAIVASLSLKLSGELKVEWELNVDLFNFKLSGVSLLSDSDNVFFIFLADVMVWHMSSLVLLEKPLLFSLWLELSCEILLAEHIYTLLLMIFL